MGEPQQQRAPLLEVERSGGAAGLFVRLRIDDDGHVTLHRPPRAERRSQLGPGQLSTLRSRVAATRFDSLSSTYFAPRSVDPDGFAWRIRHASHAVSTRDGEAPRGLAELMVALETIIDEVELLAVVQPQDDR